jgi:hypothetical protein
MARRGRQVSGKVTKGGFGKETHVAPAIKSRSTAKNHPVPKSANYKSSKQDGFGKAK